MEQTTRVAEFIVGRGYDEIPPSAVLAAKWAILDSVGVALAGSLEPAARICAEEALQETTRQEAAVFGRGLRSTSSAAAFANGVAGHALDFDWVFAVQGQPMAGLMPAVFALAEPLHASGHKVLEAYLVGFELTAKLAQVIQQGSPPVGWHATGTIGTLGCAAAAARLLGLSVDETRAAIGIASSMACGLVWNFGTMTKPLHAGLAARNGVEAARLAKRGFTANATLLDSPGGFLESFAGDAAADRFSPDGLGTTCDIVGGILYKPYPCGGLTHSAIDAVLALRHDHAITAEQVDAVDVKVTAATARRIVFRVPRTELEAKFSMPYLLARALVSGSVDLDAFTDEAIHERGVLRLAARVRMEGDPSLPNVGLGHQPCDVAIRLTDGRAIHKHVDHRPTGHGTSMTEEQLRQKFIGCAGRVLTDQSCGRALHLLETLETLDDITSLSTLLMGPAGHVSRPSSPEG